MSQAYTETRMQAQTVSLVFGAVLLASLAMQFWLATRQMRHVARHRDEVPAVFRGTVSAQAHRKAADYTLAKGRFGLLQHALGATVLLGWTLLGGLDALNGWLLQAALPTLGPLGYQIALVMAFAAIAALIDLPSEWHATFRIEQRFGFNRMTQRMWWLDHLKGAAVALVIGLPLVALVLAMLFEATRLALRGPLKMSDDKPLRVLSEWKPGHGEG